MEGELVSIVVPTYNVRFFEHALRSALGQTYQETEIVICDDSPGTRIEAICQRYPDTRLRYVKNPVNLGFAGNFTKGFKLARGVYVKFLNDDDVLLPDCVRAMVEQFRCYGDDVALLTSRRRVIDAGGAVCSDVPATAPLTTKTTYFSGIELGDRALVRSTNIIGEPTTLMFRRRDIELADDTLFKFDGNDYVCLADLSLAIRLLQKGGAVYVAEPLSHFRLHNNQLQGTEAVALKCVTERYLLVQSSRAAGFLSNREDYGRAMKNVSAYFRMAMGHPGWSPCSKRALDETYAKIPAEFRRSNG